MDQTLNEIGDTLLVSPEFGASRLTSQFATGDNQRVAMLFKSLTAKSR